MRKKTERERKQSSLVSGWTVEAEVGPGDDPARPAAEVNPSTPQFGADASGDAGSADVESPQTQLGNGALVLFGVFGGLYLLYAWSWFVIAQAYVEFNAIAIASSGVLGGFLQQAVFWAAPFAVALWFLLTVLLQRHRTLRLTIWLVVGAVVLVPLPMLWTGGAA